MTLQEFLQDLEGNEAVASKLNKAANPDEAYAIAKEAGLSISFEEFSEGMAKLSATQSELSGEEVDAIVGGATTTEIVSSVSTYTGAAAAAAAAAAV